MPLWTFVHPPRAFEDAATKAALARAVTDLYTKNSGMPAFYVVVQFLKLADSDIYQGGVSQATGKPFIRLTISQIHIKTPESYVSLQASSLLLNKH